jgi:hypothetical protein
MNGLTNKSFLKIILTVGVTILFSYSSISQTMHRIVVLTDIENEPDDAQSMVRFLLYSNHYDVEGLIATTSTHLRDTTAEWRIHEIVAAYGVVRDNLLLHEPGFPTADFLHSVVKPGIPRYGLDGVGPGMDSEGSEWLINVVDKEDKRPVWVSVWGGANVLAQALWKVQQTRTPAQLQEFISKLRVYTISDQDNSAHWIRTEFPNVFYIVSPGENYRHATWSGISGEPWYRFASGADTSIVKNPWLRKHIIHNHGPLGAEYPEVEYAMEGDTPSFLSLINNGLNVPERPDFGGWGGRYEYYIPRFLSYRQNTDTKPEIRPIWTDADDEATGKDGRIYIDNHATIWRWRDAFQHDFAARMDWCLANYEEANHPPTAKIAGKNEITVQVGEWTELDGSPSSDPDGDKLTFHWFPYIEAGTYWHWAGVNLENSDKPVVRFRVHPSVHLTKPQTTHLILEVTDNGKPSLTRYQRIIVHIMPKD